MLKELTACAIAVLLSVQMNIVSAQDEQAPVENAASSGVNEDSTSSLSEGDAAVQEKVAVLEGKLSSLEESYLETQSTAKKLAKLKISGYLQAQFAMAETTGVATSLAGAKFDKGTWSRFFVRRGRIKFNYDNGLSQYVLQFDASHGGFEIKDAYLSLTDPWSKYVTATMGIFDRPFGYEISYSSSMRESPERSRVYQTLFPKEREVGAKIAFAADKGIESYFNFKGGIFNGVTPLQLENDNSKDFIGRAGFEVPLRDIGMAIDGGFSAYYSLKGVKNTDTTAKKLKTFSRIDSSWTTKVKSVDSGVVTWSATRKYDTTWNYAAKGLAYEMDGTLFKELTGQKDLYFDRHYFGLDLQYYYDLPVIGGLTLRGEYLWGVQPGTSGSSSFYQPSAGQTPNGPLYLRNFDGYYLYWVQCLGSKLQSVVKYDMYDPNTDVEGDEVGFKDAATKVDSKTSSTDLAYTTVGLGLVYHWDDNVKVMVYYDMPSNEISKNLKSTTDAYKDFSRDIPDNVMTLRIQYKF